MNIDKCKEIISYYKSGKLSKKSVEAELPDLLYIMNCSVELDDTVSASSNTSYIAMIIPEIVNDMIVRSTLVIDDHIVKSRLSTDGFISVLNSCVEAYQTILRLFDKFKTAHKSVETSFLDCVEIYGLLYKQLISSLKAEDIQKLVDDKTFSEKKIDDALYSIANNSEKPESIIEYIRNNYVMPNIVLEKAQQLFKKLNDATNTTKSVSDIDTPEQNVLFNSMLSFSTGIIDPTYSKEVDPFYEPKR